jgi:hypothetical protein
MDELLELGKQVGHFVRYSDDKDQADKLIEQLIRTAYAAGRKDGAEAMGKRMLSTFDATVKSQK